MKSVNGFLPSVMIQEAGGKHIPIGMVEVGDELVGWDKLNKKRRVQSVVAVERETVDGLYNSALQCTVNQTFLCGGTFMPLVQKFGEGVEEFNKIGEHELIHIQVSPDHNFLLESGMVAHNGGGGKPPTAYTGGSSNESGTSTRTPLPWMQPYMEQLFKSGFDLFGQSQDLKPYEGRMIAPINKLQRKSIHDMARLARTADAGGMETRQLGLDTIGGKYLHASSNPYLRSHIEAANRDLENRFTRAVLPNISSAAQASGAYGGSRHAVAQSTASRELAQATGDVASKMSGENYARERQNQMMAPGLFMQANQILRAPADLRREAGDYRQGLKTDQLQAKLQKFMLNRQLADQPWQKLMGLGGLMSGFGQYGTTTSSGSKNWTGYGPDNNYMSPWARMFQGAAGGAGMGSIWGLPAAGIGGIIGGLGGLFGGR